VSAFGIEAAILTLMIAGILMWGYKKILNYKTYEDVKAIIRMLKAEGKTIFLTSHHYKDIEQLCDQVYSLEDCQLLPITEEIAARYREMD